MSEPRDSAEIQDVAVARVKGPDPDEWAWRDELLEQHPELADDYAPLQVGQVVGEGEEQRKGPGPQWERGEEGEYVNR